MSFELSAIAAGQQSTPIFDSLSGNPGRRKPFSISDKDKILQQDLSLEIRSSQNTLLVPEKQSTHELLLSLVDTTEDIKSSLLKADIEYQRSLGDEIIESQKRFQDLLKSMRINAAHIATTDYLEKVASGIFSLFSIGIGGMMAYSLVPSMVYAGASMITSGALSLASLGLEAIGVSDSITKPISLAGFTVGVLATAIGGYLNPAILRTGAMNALNVSKTIVAGAAQIAEGITDRNRSELEADTAQEKSKQDVQKLAQDKLAREILETVKELSCAEEASRLLRQQQELKNEIIYLNRG